MRDEENQLIGTTFIGHSNLNTAQFATQWPKMDEY